MPRRRPTFSRAAFEPQLARGARRASGVYYTPPEIVRLIVDLTLGPLLPHRGPLDKPLRVLDPACGAGEFLVAALRLITGTDGGPAAGIGVYGVDIDPAAVTTARQRLHEMGCNGVGAKIVVGDALDRATLPPASFDAIVGNPPYVNIRQLAKALPRERIDALRERYQTARGNFDLYVLFVERALELLQPGGRCGLVIPNKWATLDYARPCRELLLEETTIEHVVDLSDARAFAKASVYPQVIVFRKELADHRHLIRFREGLQSAGQCRDMRQQSLSAVAISFAPTFDVESRVRTLPLGELAKLSCGTAGFSAQRIARELHDVGDARNATEGVPSSADFITSGNIDRYAIRLGNVRYLNRTYVRPRLPLDSTELTPVKQRLFASPKIVIAGMSRRLEAAWDDRGLTLGVQVFAASECQVDPFYLLALLNSKLLSYLFATRFAAKRLAGGYLAINKGQLSQLPIVEGTVVGTLRVPSPGMNRLSELAAMWGRRIACHKAATSGRGEAVWQAESLPHEVESDRIVYELYRLTDAEIARVENHFAERSARAA